MGSQINYSPKKRESFLKWLAIAKKDESYTMDYDIGHKHNIFFAIMGNKGKAKIYNVNKWAWKSEPGSATWLISKDSIQWVCSNENKWNYTNTVRGFVRLGLIPAYDKSYVNKELGEKDNPYPDNYALTSTEVNLIKDKSAIYKPLDGDGIGIRYLRKGHLLNLNGKEIVPFRNMKFDWNGNLITKIIPAASKNATAECFKEDRDTKSRRRKANAANNKIVYKLRKAQKNNDYSDLKVNDIWYLTNVTHRTELINHFGMENIIKELDYYVKHENKINNNEYELLSVKIPDLTPNALQPEREANYLKMINPTTGEIHIEGVANFLSNWGETDPINSVGMALAWRNGDTNDWSEQDKSQVRSYLAEGSDIDTDLYAIPRTIT